MNLPEGPGTTLAEMMGIVPAHADVLVQQDTATLASWWGLMNCYEWPEDLPQAAIPQGVERYESKIMAWITEWIGHREVLRYWNCEMNGRKMNDQQFNDFWNRSRDQGAHDRYYGALKKDV